MRGTGGLNTRPDQEQQEQQGGRKDGKIVAVE